jgi:hypothetical protein
MPYRGGSLEIEFDFIENVVWLRLCDGHFRQLMLKPTAVAEFYAELDVFITINPMPCEIADCIPFDQDTVHTCYDGEYTRRFHRVLSSAHEVMSRFRTGAGLERALGEAGKPPAISTAN